MRSCALESKRTQHHIAGDRLALCSPGESRIHQRPFEDYRSLVLRAIASIVVVGASQEIRWHSVPLVSPESSRGSRG